MGFLSSIFKAVAPLAVSAIPGVNAVAAPLISAGLSGAASAFGQREDERGAQSAYNNQFNQQMALGEQQNAQRIAAAQKQMDFQERMSSTAHQREIEDLRQAGLNPVLSANGGASSPGGAMAAIADTVTPAASSALAKSRQSKEFQQMAANIDATKAQATRQREETKNAVESRKNIEYQRRLIKEQTDKTRQDAITSAAQENNLDVQTRHEDQKRHLTVLTRELREYERWGLINSEQVEKWLHDVGGKAGATSAGSMAQMLKTVRELLRSKK